MEKKLTKLYYNPSNVGSYGGVQRLYEQAKRLGVKTSRAKVQHWLSSQESYSRLKQVNRKFSRNHIVCYKRNELLQTDLMDVKNLSKSNDHVQYILIVIDCLSRRAFVHPLKDKTGKSVEVGLRYVLRPLKGVKFLQSDHGTEYYNQHVRSFLEQNNITHYSTHNTEIKAALAERFIRTLRSKIAHYMTANQTERYIDVLQQLVVAYNRSTHRSIKMRPLDVKDKRSEQQAFRNLFGVNTKKLQKSRLQPGDFVRITKPPSLFLKGSFQGQWTSEIFTIHSVIHQTHQQRPMYTIMDENGEIIKGRFYAQELQRVQLLKNL